MAQFELWTKAVEIEEKALVEEGDSWRLTGYAAVFGNIDRTNDILMAGSFQKCLAQRRADGDDVQLYYNHEVSRPPIGIVPLDNLREDRKGLRYEALLPKDDEFVSKRIVPQIKRRSLKSNSFGYKARRAERRKSDGVRLLHEVDLWEISVVNNPANPLANVEGLKGLIPFQDLRIDRGAKAWDAGAALARIKAAFGDNDEDVRRAFLFAEDGKSVDELDPRLLIADIGDDGELTANHIAIYKCTASLCGARGGVKLPEEVLEAVKSNVDRYYQRLDLSSPFSSISDGEFKALEPGEREARLKSLGVSRKLAAELSGLRDADRKTAQRDAGVTEDARALLSPFSSILEAAAAIKQQPAG